MSLRVGDDVAAGGNELIFKIEVKDGQPFAHYNTALLYQRHIEAMTHAPVEEAPQPAPISAPQPSSAFVPKLPPHAASSDYRAPASGPAVLPMPGTGLETSVGAPVFHLQQPHQQHQQHPPSTTLWIGGILPGVDINGIKDLFSNFGTVESFRYRPEKNFAFLTYTTIESAIAARQQMQGFPINEERSLRINFTQRQQQQHSHQHSTAPPYASSPSSSSSSSSSSSFERGRSQPATPPANPTVKHRIDTIVGFIVKKGLAFEKVMQEKQRSNPEFEFLFGGPFHAYYISELQRLRSTGSSSSPSPSPIPFSSSSSSFSSSSSASSPFSASTPLGSSSASPSSSFFAGSADGSRQQGAVAHQLAQFLNDVLSSRASLANAYAWATQLPASDLQDLPSAVLSLLEHRQQQAAGAAPDYREITADFVDCLLVTSAGFRQGSSALDPMARLFLPFLSDVLSGAMADQPQMVAERIARLPSSWYDRGVFTMDIVKSLSVTHAGSSPKRQRR